MHRSLESSNRMPEIYAMKSCCRESAEPSWTNRPETSTGEALASSVQHCNHFINELSPVRFEEIILSSKLTCPENIQVLVDTSILTWSMLVGGMVTQYFAPQEAQPPGVSENTALDGGCPVPPLNDDYRWNCHLGTYHDISKCIPFSDQSWSVVFFQRVTIFIIAMFKSWTHCPPTLDGPLDESPWRYHLHPSSTHGNMSMMSM
jgi:hypothetical protein